MELLSYLTKSAAILGLFYVVYWIALRRHTLFIANRQYLLTGIVAALALPLIQFTETIYLPAPIVDAASLELIENTPLISEFTEVTPAVQPIDWISVLAVVYGLGVLICAARFGYHSWVLRRVLRRGNFTKHNGYYHVETNQELAPFSFFKYLVYNPELHTQQDLEMIIQHEKAHAKGWHSLDVLLGNLLTVVHWLNPLAWWYKKSMIQNLEFIADQETVREIPSKKAYQLALVKASTQGQHFVLSNSFYQSFIKNRIVMLNTNQSHKAKRWRLLLIIPLLALFMYSFNVNEKIAYLEADNSTIAETSAPSFIIDKFSTEADLLEIENYFSSNHEDVDLNFSNEKWKEGRLTAYQLEIEFPGSESGGGKLIDENTEDEVIPRVISYKEGPAIVIEHLNDRKDYMVIDYNGLQYFNPEESIKADKILRGVATTIDSDGAGQNGQNIGTTSVSGYGGSESGTSSLIAAGPGNSDYLFIINEKPWTQAQLPKDKKIVTTGHIEMLEPSEGLAKYGQTGKDGVFVVHGEASFVDNKVETAIGYNTNINNDILSGSRTISGTYNSNRPTATVGGNNRQGFGSISDGNNYKGLSTTSYTRVPSKDITILITADMSKAQLEEKAMYLKQEHGVNFEIDNVNYKDGKIVAISITYSKGGSSGRYSSDNDGEPIDDIMITIDEDGGMSAGNVNTEARMVARKAQIEARKLAREGEMKARRLAREDEMKARKLAREGEMKARRAELAAAKAEMAAMSEERKAEMRAKMDALKAELAMAQDDQKAEMKAKIAELKMREKELAAEMKEKEKRIARARSNGSRGYARTVNGVVSTSSSYQGRVVITKDTSDDDLAALKSKLSAKGVDFRYKRVKRNSEGEITGIRISIDDNKGSKSSTQVSGDDDGIDDIVLEY